MFKKLFIFLFFCIVSVPLLAAAQAQKIQFKTADGILIKGLFWPNHKEKNTLILLHGAGSVKEEWNSFAQLAHQKGYGVLFYDARGHGKSLRAGHKMINPELFYKDPDPSNWQKMVDDLDLAVKLLAKNYHVDKQHIILCGASVGANIAMRYLAQNPDIPAAILLSPGQNYRGLILSDTLEAHANRPLFVAVSPQDQYSYQSVASWQRSLLTKYGENAKLILHIETENPGHGVQMFKRWKETQPSLLEKNIIDWIDTLKR